MKFIESYSQHVDKVNETIRNTNLSLWYAKQIVADIQRNGINFPHKIKHESFAVSPLIIISGDVTEEDKPILNRIILSWKSRLLAKQQVLSCEIKKGELFIYIKDLHVRRENPPQYLYHTTSEKNTGDIMLNGLVPKSGEWLANMEYPPAVFASISDDPQEWFQYNKYKAVFRIDTSSLPNKWWTDLNIPNRSFGYIMTFEPIPVSAIKLMYDEDIAALKDSNYQDFGLIDFSMMK